MVPATSPARRVLADKSTNASFHVRLQKETRQSPIKPPCLTSPSESPNLLLPPQNTTSTSSRAGHKRRIDEVDHIPPTDSQDNDIAHNSSQKTEVLSDISLHRG